MSYNVPAALFRELVTDRARCSAIRQVLIAKTQLSSLLTPVGDDPEGEEHNNNNNNSEGEGSQKAGETVADPTNPTAPPVPSSSSSSPPPAAAGEANKEGGGAAAADDFTPLQPEEFNLYIRRLIPPRGNRFPHDHPDTCMVIERSKNSSLVVYTANFIEATTTTAGDEDATAPGKEEKDKHSGKKKSSEGGAPARVDSGVGRRALIDLKDPIRTYWIKIPSENQRREGIMELKYIEKMFAYGCSASPFTLKDLTAKALSDKYDNSNNEGGGATKKAAADKHAKKPALTPKETETVTACARQWLEYFALCEVKYVALSTWPVVLFTLPALAYISTETGGRVLYSSDRRGSAGNWTQHAASSAEDGEDKSSPTERRQKESANQATGNSVDEVVSPRSKDVDKINNSDCPLENTVAVMVAVIGGELSVLTKVYVCSIEPKKFYQLPSVAYIEAFGISLVTGKPTYEKKTH